MHTASRRQLWLVVAVAALARLAFVSLLHNAQVSDAAVYDSLARHLAQGDGYVFDGHLSAWWPIGFPAWLSLIYRMAGAVPAAGAVANVVLGTLTAALTFLLARRISEPAALPAGLAIALLPSHVAATNLLTTETLATTLWVGAVLALWPTPRPGRAALGGVPLALGALVRPIMLMFAPISFVALLAGTNSAREWTRAAVACAAAILAVLAPWAYRNDRVFGTPVLVSTNGGYILWVGNDPLASGRYLLTNGVHSFAYARVDPDVPRNEGEIGQDVAYRRRAVEYMRSHPLGIMRLIPAKLRYLWATDNDAVSWLLDGLTLTGLVRRALVRDVTCRGASGLPGRARGLRVGGAARRAQARLGLAAVGARAAGHVGASRPFRRRPLPLSSDALPHRVRRGRAYVATRI